MVNPMMTVATPMVITTVATAMTCCYCWGLLRGGGRWSVMRWLLLTALIDTVCTGPHSGYSRRMAAIKGTAVACRAVADGLYMTQPGR